MPRDYRLSFRGRELTSIWFARFARWRQTWQRLCGNDGSGGRTDFRDALNLRLPMWTPAAPDLQAALASPQVNVYLLARAHQWYLSQLYDDDPEIRVSRTGDQGAESADFEEVLLGRAADEAGLASEFRNVITDLCWAGFGFVWLGMDVVPQRGAVLAGAQGSGEATEAALQGQHQPHPAHDHDVLADALETVAESPDTGAMLTAQQHLGLVSSAAIHRTMQAEEDARPQLYDAEKGRIWARWSPPGWTYWDPLVLDIRHSRWMARKIVVPLEAAMKMENLRPSFRARLKPQPIYEEKQGDPPIQTPLGSSQTETDAENGCVVLIEVWDKRHKAFHILNEMVDEYGEVDDSYPYVLDDGRCAIRGYFPCAPVVAVKPPTMNPDAAWGLPLLASGWPQQMEMVKIRSKMIAAAKATVRPVLFHHALPQKTREAMSSGVDVNGVEVPETIAGSPSGIANAVHFPVMPPVPVDWEKEITLIERDFFNNVGIAPNQLTGETTSETATEADIVSQASQTQIADVMRQMESGMERALEVARGLLRCGYSPEHVAGMVGKKFTEPRVEVDMATGQPVQLPSIFDVWMQESDEGDRIRTRLSARARDEDPVRIQQLKEAMAVASMPDPETGVPFAKMKPIVKELFRSLGVAIEEFTEQEVANIQANQATLTSGTGNEQPGGKKQEPSGSGGPPQRGQMNGNARAAGVGGGVPPKRPF